MRTRITWLVAATTSAVVVTFVVPLCLLVHGLAEARAIDRYRQQVQSVAAAVAESDQEQDWRHALDVVLGKGVPVSVFAPGRSAHPDTSGAASAVSIGRARSTRAAFTAPTAAGVEIVIPVTKEDGITVVTTVVPQSAMSAGVSTAWATLIALGTLLIGAAVLFARQLGRRISIPVTDLAKVAHGIREGDTHLRAQPSGPTETRELAVALNELADRIEGLLAEERKASADLGHRLRTPVTALRLDADLVTDPELAGRLRDHVDHLQRSIDAVVRDSRRGVRQALPRACDAGVIVADRAAFWSPLAEDQDRDLAVQVSSPGSAMIRLQATDLAEIVDTLLDNVFAHTPDRAPIMVRVRVEQTRVRVEVNDGGPGLTHYAIQRGRSGAGSTGLGLDIVRRLAESAGGQLRLTESQLGGLSAQVEFPLTTA